MIHVEESDAILGPLELILAVEVGIEGLGQHVEIDVVVLEHVEDAEPPHGGHDRTIESNKRIINLESIACLPKAHHQIRISGG